MSHDSTPRPGHSAEYERLQAHRRGDHTRCRPAWCLAARHDHGTPAAPAPEPARCPGCGAQLPENAPCQTAACDGRAES